MICVCVCVYVIVERGIRNISEGFYGTDVLTGLILTFV